VGHKTLQQTVFYIVLGFEIRTFLIWDALKTQTMYVIVLTVIEAISYVKLSVSIIIFTRTGYSRFKTLM
jgi:hypothetical protein